MTTHRSRILTIALAMLGGALLRPADASAQQVEMCSNQGIPTGYAVVAVARSGQCPGYYTGSNYNRITIRVPGDTVTVCNTLTPGPFTGYVITAQSRRQECPGFYSGSSNNSSTWQRISGGQPPTPAPAPASGELGMLDEYERTAYLRLAEMEEWLGLYDRTHQPWRGSAAQGQSVHAELRVRGGVRYTVVAACDDDCTDLDLRVLDGSYVLGQDVQGDAHARLELAPASDGTFWVEVMMAACGQSPCRFAVGVYETPSAAAPSGRPPRRERIRPPSGARPTRP